MGKQHSSPCRMDLYLWTIFGLLLVSSTMTTADEVAEKDIVEDLLEALREDIGEEREKRQAESTAPPSTTGAPKTITFDCAGDSKLLDSTNATKLEIVSGSLEDEHYSQWYVVTRSGQEYEGSTEVLHSIFEEARLDSSESSDSSTYTSSGSGSGSGSGPGPGSGGDAFEDELGTASNLLERFRRKVFYSDTREKVDKPTKVPWSAMGRVNVCCTGTFIGPRHILTAGHCVYSRETNKWYKNLDFHRAKDCDPDLGVLYQWKWAVTVKGWKDHGLYQYDYGMIVVDTASPVWMTHGWRKKFPLPYFVNTAGYPKSKPGKCLWTTFCLIKEQWPLEMSFRCDITSCNSGSAVFAYNFDKTIVHFVAVSETEEENYCTKITKFRFHQLNHLIKKY